MRKIYKVFSISITEIDVIKETDHTIWYNKTYCSGKTCEVSERKNTNENRHFDTKKEACDYLIKTCTDNVSSCEKRLSEYKDNLSFALYLCKND